MADETKNLCLEEESKYKMEIMAASSQDTRKKIHAIIELSNKEAKKEKRVKSKLNHDEWLVYMRSVWRFDQMTTYVKTGIHPAQFSAEIPKRVIRLYSFVNDLVFDPFVGTGTTLVEAMKLKRFSIGLDINPEFLELSNKQIGGLLKENLDRETLKNYEPILILGNAGDLQFLNDESIDLIMTHPPYWNAVKMSEIEEDFANINEYSLFLANMREVFVEMKRVLKPERVCAVFTGDVLRRINKVTQLYPLHADYIQIARESGLRLWDIFIVETKIRKSGGKPMMGSYPYPHKLFSEFAHNYLLIFRKI
jgi:DNA modification methylase